MQRDDLQLSNEYIHFKIGLTYPKEFTLYDALIISRILSFQLNNKTYFESQSRLAKHLLTTRQLINRRIKHLVKENWITKDFSADKETLLLKVNVEKLNTLSQPVTEGCNDLLQGGVTERYRGCNGALHYNKHYNKLDNKEDNTSAIASGNASPNGSASLSLKAKKETKSPKPDLTLEQIKEIYKDHEHLEAITDWYVYKLKKKQPYKDLRPYTATINKHGKDFPQAVKDSIERGVKGIFLYTKQKEEWQIRKEATDKAIVLFNDLFAVKDDENRFKLTCEESDIKELLKQYMYYRGEEVKNIEALRLFFLSLEGAYEYTIASKRNDFKLKIADLAVKQEKQKGD